MMYSWLADAIYHVLQSMLFLESAKDNDAKKEDCKGKYQYWKNQIKIV